MEGMPKKLYGVDLSQEVTPLQVRDAIRECFEQAHCDVLEQMKEFHEFKSEEEFKEMEKIDVTMIIRNIFVEIGADFENPTKEDLIKVVEKLGVYASNFRKPDIIKKHQDEMAVLLHKLT